MTLAALVVERRAPLHELDQRRAVDRLGARLDVVPKTSSARLMTARPSPSAMDFSASRASASSGSGRPSSASRASSELVERLVVETVEAQHGGARQHGGVELEGRVLGRRADERDRAVLHVGEEAVLLRAVEAVDLVDEKQRAAALLAPRLGAVEGFAQILDAGEDRRELLELELDVSSASRRATVVLPEPGGPQRIMLGRRAAVSMRVSVPSGPTSCVLADDLGELLRAQAVGQRARRAFLEPGRFEEIGHERMLNHDRCGP